MTEYLPDNWVVLKITYQNETVYKVLGGWSGGYLDGDSWRMNSGITRVEDHETYYNFYGYSGSVYKVGKQSYGLRMNNAGVYNQLTEKFGDAIEMMPEDTDWMNMKWQMAKVVDIDNFVLVRDSDDFIREHEGNNDCS